MGLDILLNSGIIGAVFGAIFGALAGGGISWLFLKRSEKKENSEKIYAPLLTEFKNNLTVVETDFSSSFSTVEWNRLTHIDHLTHRIKPKIKENVESFYEKISGLYNIKYNFAREKIRETVDKELNKRVDKELNKSSNFVNNSICEYLYPEFIAGKLLNNQIFLKQKLSTINEQLNMKYNDLGDFFKENLELLNKIKEIKEVREERDKVINHINQTISLLEKELK